MSELTLLAENARLKTEISDLRKSFDQLSTSFLEVKDGIIAYRNALEEILHMKKYEGEDWKYVLKKCWHIAYNVVNVHEKIEKVYQLPIDPVTAIIPLTDNEWDNQVKNKFTHKMYEGYLWKIIGCTNYSFKDAIKGLPDGVFIMQLSRNADSKAIL